MPRSGSMVQYGSGDANESHWPGVPTQDEQDLARGRVLVEDILRQTGRAKDEDTRFIFIKTPFKLSLRAKIFLSCVALSTLVLMALTVAKMVLTLTELHEHPFQGETASDFFYAILLLINALFCAYYAVHGCVKEQRMELYAFALASILVTIYVCYQFASQYFDDSRSLSDRNVKLIRFVLIVLLEPVCLVLVYFVALDFGWLSYRVAGADPRLQQMFRVYRIFGGFVKMDLQIGISFVLLCGFSEYNSAGEITVDVLALLLCVVWAAVGWYGIKRESLRLIYAYGSLSLFFVGYVIYKIVDVMVINKDRYAGYDFVQAPIVVSGIASLFIRGLLLYWSFRAYKNFGNGLSSRVLVKQEELDEETSALLAG